MGRILDAHMERIQGITEGILDVQGKNPMIHWRIKNVGPGNVTDLKECNISKGHA
jgi:hypothetical protein